MFASRLRSYSNRSVARWTLSAAMLGVSLCIVSCSGKSKADKLYDEGMLFYKHRSYYQAIDRFEEALKLQPDNTAILVRDADANLKINKPEQAIKYGQAALAKKADLDEASLIVGQANLQLALTEAKPDKNNGNKPILNADRLKEAARISSELHKRKPDSTDAAVLDARIDFFSEKFEDSERLYRTVLAKEPENTNATIGLIDLLMSRLRFVESEVLARTALEKTPKDTVPNPIYVNQLATSLEGLKKYDEAYLALQPYVSPENKNPQISLYLTAGQLLLTQLGALGNPAGEAAPLDGGGTTATLTASAAQTSQGKTTDTSKAIKTAIERLGLLGTQMKGIYSNNPESWFYRGVSYELSGDMPKAIQHYQEAASRAPDVKKYRLVLAMAHLKTGNLAQAQQEASNLLKYQPGDFDGRLVMAGIKIQDGSISDAVGLLRDLHLERPDEQRVMQMLGRQLVMSGDPKQIEEGLKIVSRLGELHVLSAPDQAAIEASAKFSEGLALARQGKVEEANAKLLEAEKNLNAVVAQQPENSQAELLLSELSESRRDYFSALKHAQKAAAIAPGMEDRVAQVYVSLGQWDAASGIYKKMIARNPQGIGNVQALAEIDVRRNKPEDAIKSLEYLIEKRPDDYASYVNKSRAQALSKQPDAAMKTLEDAKKKFPEEPALTVEMARLEMSGNEVKKAIDLLAGAQKATSDKLTLKRAQGGDTKELQSLTNAVASLDLELATCELFGGLYDSAGEHAMQCRQVLGKPNYQAAIVAVIAQLGKQQPQAVADAIDQANSASSIKTEPGPSTLVRSLSLAASGKLPEALKAAAEAKGIDADTRDLYDKLIQGASAADLTKAAAPIAMQIVMAGAKVYAPAVNDQCDAALKLLPENPFILSRKAETLRLMDQQDESLKVYDRLALVAPQNPAVPTVQAEVYLAQREKARRDGNAAGEQAALAKAAEAATKAMQLRPGDKEAMGRVAILLQEQKKLDDANALYRKLIEIDPGNWTAYNNLAYNLAQMNKLDEAQQVAEKAMSSAPPSGQNRGMIQDTVGWIALQKGDTAKALELLKSAVVNDPNNPDIRMHLAQAYQKTGQADLAAVELEGTIKTLPANPEIGEVRELLRTIKPDSAMLKPAPEGA